MRDVEFVKSTMGGAYLASVGLCHSGVRISILFAESQDKMAADDCPCTREVVAMMDVGPKGPADNQLITPTCDVHERDHV